MELINIAIWGIQILMVFSARNIDVAKHKYRHKLNLGEVIAACFLLLTTGV